MLHYFRNNRGLPADPVAGFTLVELMVSLAIVSVILTVVVSNQSTYTDGAALMGLADEISSSVSQAQAYGIGVKEFSPGSGEFDASYGLAFSLLSSDSNTAYLSFADRDPIGPALPNQSYDGDWSCPVGGSSECLGKVDISRGNYIESLCVVRSSGADNCSVARRVDISFARPDTETQLIFFNTSGGQFNPPNMIGAKIVLQSPGGSTRSVTVYSTGQISVQ
ncbi:MAG: type II secretion system protein [bacterium]|nr:type II secretion system protein [bacterium]